MINPDFHPTLLSRRVTERWAGSKPWNGEVRCSSMSRRKKKAARMPMSPNERSRRLYNRNW